MTTKGPVAGALPKVLRLDVVAFGAVGVVMVYVAGIRLHRMPWGFLSHVDCSPMMDRRAAPARFDRLTVFAASSNTGFGVTVFL